MEYVTFDPKIHDSKLVATYMYEVDYRTFDMLFNNNEKAISTIEKSLKKDDCIKLIYENDEIIGMLICYTYDKKSKSHINSLRLLIVDILDYFVLCDIEKDDLYIAEIAIDKSHRSKGYGSKVIQDVLRYARKNNYKRVTLDADFRNTRAKVLYEKIGFKVFNRKSFLKRGMYNMEFIFS